MKTILQCDFDGTVTFHDVSFLILDTYGSPDWRQILEEYKEGKITVGRFNSRAFTTVKEDKQTMLRLVRERAEPRPGFAELLAFCRQRDWELVIVSNGLDFYIRAILSALDAEDVRVFAAKTRFGSDGVVARYIGPDGQEIQAGFKEAYIRSFKSHGHRVIYAGNGFSDVPPAREAFHVFATSELLDACRKQGISHTPFKDLNDIARGLESLSDS